MIFSHSFKFICMKMALIGELPRLTHDASGQALDRVNYRGYKAPKKKKTYGESCKTSYTCSI